MQAPPSENCQVVELRQYTLHPGQRDVLIELFDREFLETQEAVGMRVIGQFRRPDAPDQFVWLRGFADMQARAQGLQAFYGGPVWAEHRNAANATMIDSDNVLLLKPAWPGSAVASRNRPPQGATSPGRGAVEIVILHLAQPAGEDFIAQCRDRVTPGLLETGARVLGWYTTEYAPNNFPRLPVREGEHVVVAVTLFEDREAQEHFAACRIWEAELAALAPWLARPAERLRLAPTARSAVHA
jgi:hypothetical protein